MVLQPPTSVHALLSMSHKPTHLLIYDPPAESIVQQPLKDSRCRAYPGSSKISAPHTAFITQPLRYSVKIPVTETLARLMRPAKPIERQARDAHKQRTIKLLAALQSIVATTRVVPSGATTPARCERCERAHSLGQVFVRMRDRVDDDALPWTTGSCEGLAGSRWWDRRCWRCGESIRGGRVEIFDGECSVAPRDVPPCRGRKVCLKKRQAARKGNRRIR